MMAYCVQGLTLPIIVIQFTLMIYTSSVIIIITLEITILFFSTRIYIYLNILIDTFLEGVNLTLVSNVKLIYRRRRIFQ